MHIDVHGAGADIVLIHGWAMHGGIFAPLVAALAPRFRVHVVDLPGHGFSRDDGAFDLADAARRVAAATPRAIWLGWSLGGLVALRGAIDDGAQLRGLVAMAATPRFTNGRDWSLGVDGKLLVGFAADLRSRYREAIERFLALETAGSPNALAELRELRQRVFERGEPRVDALEAGLDALLQTDLRDDIERLAMPSLWIGARRDRLIAPAAMRWCAAHAPSARYLEINSGHAPFLHHAEAIAAAVGEFAERLAP